MSHSNDEMYNRRITELEAENARLRDALEFVKAERKALRDELYGPVHIDVETTDDEYLQRMKNHQPGSGVRFLEELGLHLEKPS